MSLSKIETVDFETSVLTISRNDGGDVSVPDAALLFGASFQRLGQDLYMHNEGAPSLRVEGYFSEAQLADLVSPNGAVLRGTVVEKLAGPIAPAQYTQAGDQPDTGPIGQVETVDGTASVQRSDGSVQELQVGSKILQNDVLLTDEGGKLSVTFVDGTIFTLAPNSRMVVDELIYDPDGSDNSGGFSLIQGGFVFIAGQVAKTGGMVVDTPSATMGIRGTTVLVDIQAQDGVVTSEFSLTYDPDGGKGEIVLLDRSGNVIANITDTDTKWIVRGDEVSEQPRTSADNADDNLIIADAVAAYQSALTRVQAGKTFVDFGSSSSAEDTRMAPNRGESGKKLDAVDEPIFIEPERFDGGGGTEGEGGSFEEGRNRIETEELEAVDTEVTGDEDSGIDQGPGITGQISAPGEGSLTYALESGPANGRVNVDPSGNFAYVPKRDFNGDDRFEYSVTNEAGNTGVGTVTVHVQPVNDAPELLDSSIENTEDVQAFAVLSATDIDGDSLTYSIESGPANGLLNVQENGTLSYTPDIDFEGADSFQVRVDDGAGGFDIATVSVTVLGVNDAPRITTPVGENLGTLTDGSAVVKASGRLAADDVDAGAALIWTGSAGGTYGDFVIDAEGGWEYTLNTSAAAALTQGDTVSESFTATVTDDLGETVSQLVSILVIGSNDAPRVTSDESAAKGTVVEGSEMTWTSGKLLANDPDNGSSVTWTGTAAGVLGAFTIAANGDWDFRLDNSAADSLSQGETSTETFVATATDNLGAITTQQVVVTIVGTNDAPILEAETVIELAPGETASGVFSALDVENNGALTFSPGAVTPANGTLILGTDGRYQYTPDAGFQGVDRFEYTVTDADGGVSTAKATIEVVQSTGTGEGGQTVSVAINAGATADGPAGSVLVSVQPVDASSINLVFALDRSGSIGREGWAEEVEATASALEILAAQFAGSATTVDVKIITYSNGVTALPVTDLQDPSLPDAIRALKYSGGGTNWERALSETEAFLDGQPTNEANFLFFVTDGDPTSGNWERALDSLMDVDENGYTVNIEAFGIGNRINFGNLEILDSDPTVLSTPADLASALTATPAFNPELVEFRLSLEVDGIDMGIIADKDSSALATEGLNYTLALAEVDGLAEMLGTSNRFSVHVGFDLDGNPETAEVALFATEVFKRADSAQTLTGLDQSDLLFGSAMSDDISGAGGNDLIFGFEGDDLIDPGTGADTVLAGGGDDRLLVSGAPGALQRLDGGAGRDVLDLDVAGNVSTDLLPMLSISDIEAIDLQNDLENHLTLSISDVLDLSTEADTELETLLNAALPESATIYGDVGDTLTLQNGPDGVFTESTDGPVSDSEGNTFAIYEYVAAGSILATIGVDEEIAVATAPPSA